MSGHSLPFHDIRRMFCNRVLLGLGYNVCFVFHLRNKKLSES